MKILLGTSNTKWGVIVKPQSSNVYRNILSFDTPQLKDDFLNTEVFQNPDGSKGDYKTELRNSNNRAVMEVDSLTIQFRVNETEYPYETFDSLLNKDFCAMQDEHGKIKFYAITDAQRKGNIIEYSAELDIFFTHDIKDIFNDNETKISRAMTDRFQIGLDDKGQRIIYPRWLSPDGNDGFKSPFFSHDDYEESLSKSAVPVGLPEPALFDYKPYMDGSIMRVMYEHDYQDITIPDETLHLYNHLLDNELKEYLNYIINSINYEIIHYKLDGGGIESHIRLNSMNINNNLKNMGLDKKFSHIDLSKPIQARIVASTTTPLVYDPAHMVGDNEWMQGFTQNELKDPKVVKNTRQISSIPPFAGLITPENFKIHIRVRENPFGKLKEYIEINLMFAVEDVIVNGSKTGDMNLIGQDNKLVQLYKTNTTNNNVGFKLRDYLPENDSVKRYYGVHKKNLFPIEITKPLYNMDYTGKLAISNKVSGIHPNEVKADMYPFRYFLLKNFSDNQMILAPQNLTTEYLKFSAGFGYLIDSWNYFAIIHNYKNFYNPTFDISNNENQFFVDVKSYSLYTESSAWEEYSIRNKSQMQTSQNSSIANAVMGGIGAVAGAGASLASGNPLGVAGSLFGGISQSVKSAMEIQKLKSLKTDLQNTPNTINNTGTTLPVDLNLKVNQLNITEYRTEPYLNLLIREHIYKYGYNFQGQLKSINDVIGTRYYFNYIEASETFENVKLPLSANIKQIINDTLEQGLTIWNVRDLAKFKGIKNYNYENLEMSMIGNP